MVMFTLFPARKSFPATQHTSLTSHINCPFPVRARCTQTAAEAWCSSQTAEHCCSRPSDQVITLASIKSLASVKCLPLLPLFPMPFCAVSLKRDTGPSGNFLLTFYTNISRWWNMGCSSSFLRHFKVY